MSQFGDRMDRIDEALSKVLVQLARIDLRNQSADLEHGDHEQRIRSLERWRWSLPGAAGASAIAALASLLAVVLHH